MSDRAGSSYLNGAWITTPLAWNLLYLRRGWQQAPPGHERFKLNGASAMRILHDAAAMMRAERRSGGNAWPPHGGLRQMFAARVLVQPVRTRRP
jgi:hypothetical protein